MERRWASWSSSARRGRRLVTSERVGMAKSGALAVDFALGPHSVYFSFPRHLNGVIKKNPSYFPR